MAVPNEQRVSGEVHCLEHSPGVFSCECNSTPPPGPVTPPPSGNCETVSGGSIGKFIFYLSLAVFNECILLNKDK